MKTKLLALFLCVYMAFAGSFAVGAYDFATDEADTGSAETAESTESAEASEGTEKADDTVVDPSTDGMPGAEQSENTAEDVEEVPESGEMTDDEKDELPFIVQPTDRLYRAFDDIIELYIKEHLYEFTREQALEKFVYDLINEHPEFYTMFINTFLGTMDKYSAYHEKSDGYMSINSSKGYGISIQDTGKEVVIRKVFRDSAAELAGLKEGDVIKKIGDMDVSALPWDITSEILRIPQVFFSSRGEDGKYIDPNPFVTIVVEREGKLLEITLQKGVMTANECTYTYVEEEGVACITLTSFVDENLADDFNAMLRQIEANGIKKLVIDLRDNGGGSLDLVLRMAEQFVPSGETLCYIRTKEMKTPDAVLSTTDQPVKFDSISVLVNKQTASAAELMASILRTKVGAVLVGETTFGKALGQSVYGFLQGDSFTVTTYEVLDANGESYNDVGLIPDLVIDNVEILYQLEKLPHFNHTNYKTIVPGEYNEACLALEKRLEIMGYFREGMADGIWDDNTKTAVFVLQKSALGYGDGTLDDKTVTLITDLINRYKDYIYLEDSQLDVALLYHSSFSQAKRLVAEKKQLAKEQQKLIEEHNKRLEEIDDLSEL